VIDVRTTSGGKTASVTSVGQVVSLNVYATVTGKDSTGSNDGFQSLAGSFLSTLSSSGAVRGNLTASNVSPFNGSSAQAGKRQDLNSDSDIDVGTNSTKSFTDAFNARDDSLDYSGTVSDASQQFLIATLTFTVTNLSSGQATSINFRPWNNAVSPFAVWSEDKAGRSEFNGSFSVGAAVVVTKSGTATTGSIAGNLYNDVNGNGSRQTGEPNLAGRKFFIDANKNGKLDTGEVTALTDSNGNFKFGNLNAGTYRIREALPSGWRVSVAPNVAWSKDVTIAAGQNVTGINFADTQKVLIAGSVFNDANSNKVKDSGEAGLSGWRVYFDLNNDGKFESNEPSTLTDSSGNYYFGTLSANTFHIRVVPPTGITGFSTTTPTGGVYTFTLGSGALTLNKIFGEHKN
jgi:hypothetical protein